jgi:hypothetical protein
MDFGSINWLAVIVCVLVNIAIGSTWFSPRAFFPAWWTAIGKTKTDQPGMTGTNAVIVTFGITIIAAIVVAIFMSLMVTALGKAMPGGVTLLSGAATGFLLWLGFVAPTSIANRVFAAN